MGPMSTSDDARLDLVRGPSRRRQILRYGVVLGALWAVLGCNGAAEEALPNDTTGPTEPAADPDAQPDIVDEDGSRYVWQRKIPVSEAFQERVLGPRDVELQGTFKLIADMTVEELAAKLRPRRFRNGHEYLLDHDPIDLAIKAKAGAFSSTEGGNPAKYPVDLGRVSHTDSRRPVPESLPSNPNFIVGSDDRVSYDQAAVSWPAMTSLLVEGAHCTATTIGTRTAATAAHCFFNGTSYNFGTGNYLRYASPSSYALSIPDLSTVSSHFRVSDCPGATKGSSSSVVILSIHHSWVRDLVVRLISPSNNVYTLHNRGAGWLGSNDYLWGIYNLNLSTEPVAGRWSLMITDAAGQDVGTLDYWQLGLGLPTQCTTAAYRGENRPLFSGSAIDIDLPSGWNGSDWQFDYARVNFPVGTFSQWGWVGTSIAPPGSDRTGQSANMWGYPDHRPAWNTGRPQTDANWVYPRLFMKNGGIHHFMVFPSSLSVRSAYIHDLDIYSGDSGAGLLDLSGSLIGIQSTQWNTGPYGLNFYWNEARAWDATTAAFFSAGGRWP